MNDCIFCKIIAGEIPCTKVYEDETVFAFRDINPQAPVHILVIPKKHVASLSDIDDLSIMQDLTDAIQQITKEKNITSYRTIINTGSEAGQTVFHLHLHILAGRPLLWPPG